jgi:cyclopropane-fatty-acyl-phospholipid synthase
MDDLIGRLSAAPPSRGADRWLGRLLERRLGEARLRILLRDGTVLLEPALTPVAEVVLEDRGAALALLFDPAVRFGDAYASGRIDIQGDLVAALVAASEALGLRRGRRRFIARGHSRRAARHNVHRHYDLGNDFYRLWLDERMVYTCAYFPRPEASLEDAQVAKLDHVCRKLRLRPGETVVEAGCGWGALALHMARAYGARVKAFNVSTEQIRYARSWAEREGLSDRVEFVLDDYRNVSGRFDVFVSVGMLEHVGLGRYRALGRIIDRCLDPARGRGLLHFIGQNRTAAFNPWIRKRVFPGAYPPTLAEAAGRVLQAADVDILDVENLRRHYALTLSHWHARYEAAFEEVKRRFGAFFARTWRLYLAGSEAAFRTGSLQLYQVLFARPGAEMPWTRAALYTPADGAL